MLEKIRHITKTRIALLDEHTLEVIKKSSASTVVKVAGIIAGLVISIVLGRTLGANGLGIINLANSIVNFLVVITMLGMPNVLVKEIAIAHNRKDWEHIGNCMHTAFRLNGGISLIVVIVLVIFTPNISVNLFHTQQLTIPLTIAIVMIIPMVFSRIYSSGLIGYRKIWQSNLVDQTLSIWVVGIQLLIFILLKIEITVINVAVMYAVGRIIVTFSVGIYWKKLHSSTGKKKLITPILLKTALPLLLFATSSIVANNINSIMLGWLRSPHEVGLYSVAARIALLTGFFLQVSNATVAPKIAALYAGKKIQELEKMIQRVTSGLLVIGLFTLILFLFTGTWILSIWGNEFKEAYWILIILGIGQFITLGSGAVGLVLIMTGFEKVQARISVIFMILNLLLNYILIIEFGILGAAIATTIILVGDSITRFIYVHKRLKISPFPVLFKKE